MKKHGKGGCSRQKTAVRRLRGGWDKDEGMIECDHMAEGGLERTAWPGHTHSL